MRSRFFTAVGALATLSVISVPAQQPGPAAAYRAPGSGVLPGTTSSAFTTIQGSVLSADSTAFAHKLIRLRDARVGRVVATLLSDDDGLFVFRGVDPGSYVAELMSDERTVLAASTLIHVNAGDVGRTVIRQPASLKQPLSVIGYTDAHAAGVTAAAVTQGILAAQATGPDVSPR